MGQHQATDDPIDAVALLAEPRRRQLYEHVLASREPVGRDEAAAALGIARELAAFHLDKLVAGGLLETSYRRRGDRTGPGAGRPAKFYRRTGLEISVSFPPRRYEVVADVFADALERLDPSSAAEAAETVAHTKGMELGSKARRTAGSRPSRRRRLTTLLGLLRDRGYEPDVDPEGPAIYLRNCPYPALVSAHRQLTCGMNKAWAEGLVEGLGDLELTAESDPLPGRCCVVVRPKDGQSATALAGISG